MQSESESVTESKVGGETSYMVSISVHQQKKKQQQFINPIIDVIHDFLKKDVADKIKSDIMC